MGTFFSSLDVSRGTLKNLLLEVFKSTRKVQNVRQAATGSGDTEQNVFEVKGCATGCGNLCNLVVWRKCSKAGAFPALWWLSGTVYSGECLKESEKCSM
mgnify:CR=1 FL=1